MRIAIISIILLLSKFSFANSATFKNYSDLDKCIKNYSSFVDYKSKLKKCFSDQGINIDDETLKVIENKTGIINDIVDLNLPNKEIVKKKKSFKEIFNEIVNPDLEKIAQEESIFNKPTVFSNNYNEGKNFTLNDKDFSKLNKHIKSNPKDIYALTEDINYLAEWTDYMSEFKRQELLLNVYNTFNPIILSTFVTPKTPINAGILGSQAGVLAVAGAVALAGGGGGGGGGSSSPSPATLSFSVSASSLGECDSAITITGSLTKAHSSNVSISYSTAGTATSGTDYNLSATSSTIVSGSTSASITLTPVNDTTSETSETVILTASTSDVSTTGNTQTTITIYDYVLKCNTTAYTEGSVSDQNTIKNRSSWTTVDQSSNNVHPYELFNLHKVHSFSSSGTSLLGDGQTVYVVDDAMHNNHASFSGKTVTMLDSPAVSNNSVQHGTHVASIISGVVGGTTHGVAPDVDIVFSTFNDNGTSMASDYDTARTTHSAIAANNSWGYSDGWNGSSYTSASTWSELETDASNNGRNIREQLENSFTSHFGTHTSTLINAWDNFQNNGVIVWASSNYSADSDVSFLAALPAYFNGTDDAVDLSDAWLSVMYAEFTGTSLSGASTSDFNRLGNPCGAAKEWCLVVDDKDIAAAGYVDSNGSSIYNSIGGSSMGAPQVSGMIALLAQAFPNHTPAQLTDRLLASANNAWFTPSGNTTFTIHGASIKHGYNDTWGHGVPDLYSALSPVTTSLNPLSFGGGGGSGGGGGGSGGGQIPFSQLKKYPVSVTSFSSSSSMGNAISRGLENKFTYAYDALHGGFKLNLSDFINTENKESQKIQISINEELENLRKNKFKNKLSQNVYEGEFINIKNNYGYGTIITLDAPNLAIQNSQPKNNFYINPFMTENNGIGLNQKIYLSGNDLLISYNNSINNPLTNINKDLILPIETMALSFNINNKNFNKLSLTAGMMKEKESFLLSKSSGAFGFKNNNLTNFYGINLSKDINNNSSISFNNITGISKLNNNNDNFVIGSSDVLSSSFEIDYELKNIFGKDKFKLSLSQPNRIESGDMKFRFIGLSDKNGIIPYQDHTINLSPSGRQKDITINYVKEFENSIKVGFKTVVTDDLGHIKQDKYNSDFVLTGSLKF